MTGRLRNTAVVQFATPTSTWGDPTHFGLWAGTNFLYGAPLDVNVSAPAVGGDVSFVANKIVVTITGTTIGYTDAGHERMLLGLVTPVVQVSLHTADPGATGDNELTGRPYARITVAAASWTID